MIVCTLNIYTQSYKYGEWRSVPCFEGIQFRTKMAGYNYSAKKYKWILQFKNLYPQFVSFGFAMKENAQSLKEYTVINGVSGRQTLKPDETNVLETIALLPTFQSISVVIGYVRFEVNDIYTAGIYATCTQADIKGNIDFLCHYNPKFGCKNYKEPSQITNSTKPKTSGRYLNRFSNEPLLTKEQCQSLASNEFIENKISFNPEKRNYAVTQGEFIKEKCKNLTPKIIPYITKSIVELKMELGDKYTKFPLNPPPISHFSDYIAQSEAIKETKIKRNKSDTNKTKSENKQKQIKLTH